MPLVDAFTMYTPLVRATSTSVLAGLQRLSLLPIFSGDTSMKKVLVALAATASVSFTFAAVGAPSASAAGKGCVTKSEYKKVTTGMAKAKVHKIFGTKGTKVTLAEGVEGRSYKVCTSSKGGVGILYGDGKVVSKAAKWR